MLLEKVAKLELTGVFLSADQLKPFPNAADRGAWNDVSSEAKEQWVSLAEQYFDFNWPALKMEHYMALKRKGDIHGYLNPHWERRSVLGFLAIAECIEGKGRYLDQIINGVFCICEETSWMQPMANTYLQKVNLGELLPDEADHIVDLSSSETAALLTWTYYLLKEQFDSISPRIGQRIEREVRNRVLMPYLEHDDYWWMGFLEGVRVNNWNPWCNSSVLMGFLVLEKDAFIRERGILKVMRSLDVFIATHSPDGCCDEGPMYWSRSGGSLYDCLELLDLASSHKVNIFNEPIVKEIGRYLYKVHIHGDYCVDFADGDAKAGMQGDVAFGYGKCIKDDNLMQLGASTSRRKVGAIDWFPLYRYIRDIFQEKERKSYGVKAPYVRDSWMAHAQVMTARETEGSEKGLYLAAKGGHNLESHNHNDVGGFIVYADGLPVLIDLGTEAYTSQTFSPQRFELWYLQSAYHNLPTVRGVMQQDGGRFRAKQASYRQFGNDSEMQVDISEAYPQEAGIISWSRSFRLVRDKKAAVEITDHYSLNEPTDELYFSIMTVCEPVQGKSGSFILEYDPGKHVVVRYDAESFIWNFERIELTDKRLQSNWGNAVYRILLKAREPMIHGTAKINLMRI
ncbi:heparinase II/III domain-containing protein [Cohnella silvisoli]|uniref:Heparinase II/III family protein n=1 Tax=Cohnella silvisoli TaxID=2873699 RepID=A0ABV1KKY5_9BACL|nr:heparinase II/III family protein [Cohnella silvisoli]MCD9020850.1 heparinase II/III-family protein [Cohnella silvisoli]